MGFTPLQNTSARLGFTPIAPVAAEPERQEQPGGVFSPALETVKDIVRVYPVAETAANLATQGVALPIAGIAGLGAAAAKALGITEAEPADVVHNVAGALTYQPVTKSGQHLTGTVMIPFEKLQQAGQYAGGKTLDATDSPAAAAAVDTAVQSLPMVLGVNGKGRGTVRNDEVRSEVRTETPANEPGSRTGFTPINETMAQTHQEATQGASIRSDISAHTAGTENAPTARNSISPEIVTAYELARDGITTEGGKPNAILQVGDILYRAGVIKDAQGFARVAEDVKAVQALQLPEDARQQAIKGVVRKYREEAKNGGIEQEVQGGMGRMEAHEGTLPESRKQELPQLRGAGNYDMPGVVDELSAVPGGRRAEAGPLAVYLAGADRHQRELPAGQREMGEASAADQRAEILPPDHPEWAAGNRDGNGAAARPAESDLLEAGDKAGHGAGDSGARPASSTEGFAPVDAQRPDIERTAMGQAAGDFQRDAVRPAEIGDAVGQGADARGSGFSPLYPERASHDTAGMVEGAGREAVGATGSNQARSPAGAGTDAGRLAIDQAAHEAATSPMNNLPHPTVAQIEAGNYRKGAVKLHGLDIAIENPKGSTRSGVSPEGKPWSTTMENHYGYIKRTTGRDGDAVDVFIGPRHESQRVFVVDQVDPRTGKFDEHKTILGADSAEQAKAIYHANYEPGWKGAAAVTEMSMPEFKAWLKDGNTKKPMGIQRVGGKHVTEYGDAALERLSKTKLLADDARARIEAEMARRAEASKASVSMDSVVTPDVVTADVTGKAPVNSGMVNRPVNTEAEGFNKVSTEMPETAVDSRASWAPGANYTGFVDRAETAGKLADKPIRREDVLTPLMKALGTRVYEGRVKGKNRLGTFMPKLEAVRIKRKGDLEVAAHEIAHLLDDRIPEIRKSWLSGPNAKVYAEELRGVSYDKAKVYEGFAEFVRLYMTQPEKAQAVAPHFTQWFNEFTQRHEYGPAIRKAQADMGAWFGQDALHRAQSKIGTSKELNKALDGIGDQFRQSVIDDLHGVMRMERQMTGKTSPVGAYETARLTRGAYAITDGAIRMGHPVRKADGSFAFEGKGLEKILDPVSERLDEFLTYAVGKSAQELMGQGREHLFTPAEVNAMVALERPEFRKAFADYQEFNNGVLDFAESMGIINPQSRAMWSRTRYLPFYRVGQAGANKSAGGVTGNWQGVHKLTGGSGNLRDILGNMTQNASMLISASLRNEARAKIAELAEQPGGGQFMAKIAGDAKPVRIDREQVSKAVLEALGLDKATIKGNPEAARLAEHAKLIEQQIMASPGMFEFFQHNQAPKGDVMAVLKDGRPTYYEVADPLLMRAISALERPAQHWLTNLLGIPKRIGQATITMTPDFMVANIARDTIMGSVMSRGGFLPVVDSLKGMASRVKQDPAYQEFIANGGGMASYLLDETNMRAHLERFYTSKGINIKTVMDAPDKVMYGIETIADAFEMSTRLGEYKRLREQGAHPRHAAYAARDISTDFAMKGDSNVLGFMYDTVMFLRPAVVSMDRLYRGLAHDSNRGAIAAKSAAIAGMSAALYMLNRDNPKYQDLEDWDKDNYWHFFVPRPDGSDVHLRYPKIWEIGAVASVAERTMEHTLDGDALGYGKDAARILGNVFHLNLMPQVIAPLAEQAANRNSFTGRPIETQGMEDMQPFLRAKPYTSETLKAAGMATRGLPEALQVNPVRAEALVRGYFNTWGTYGLMLADQAFFGDKLPEKRLDEMPVLRRFYEGEPAKHTKFESQFYDMLGEAKRLHNTMRALDKMNRPEIATEIEQRPMTGMNKQLERANKELRGINGDMLEVRRSDLTPAEKRQRLDALTVEKNDFLKATVLDVKQQQKEAAR